MPPKIPRILSSEMDTAVISKLIVTENPNTNSKDTTDYINISKYTSMKIESNDTILSMFPDLELGVSIMVNSVISPNDMVDTNLLYNIEDLPLPVEVANIVIKYIDKYLNKEYNIEDNLDTILEESYYTKGGYVTAVIPEAALDEIVNYQDYTKQNVSIEGLGLNDNIGILADAKHTISVESLAVGKVKTTDVSFTNDLVTFTDNPGILAYKDVCKQVTNKSVKNLYQTSLEDIDYKLEDIFKSYLNNDDESPHVERTIVKNIHTTNRKSIGRPLVIKLPIESVIPIHVPGDPSEHIGYFVLLNEQGVPLTDESEWSKSEEEERLALLTESNLSAKANSNLSTFLNTVPKIADLERIYSDIFNNEITQVLNNSVYGGISEISNINHIYTTMLHRALRHKHTRILFLDKSTISYIAFNYRDNGTGMSQLEKLRPIASVRAITKMARVMANIKNAIPTTNIDVKLDPDDPDPEKTVEMVIDEVTKSRALMIPVGLQNMNDLVEWSRKVGFKFNFKHDTRLPDMDIDYNDIIGERAEPDTDLDETHAKEMINGIGLTPEKVDSAYSGDFATTEILNDILMVKRIVKIQKKYEIQLTNYVRTLLHNDFKFREELKELYLTNVIKIKRVNKHNTDISKSVLKYKTKFLEYLIRTTLENITVKLPRPEYKENDNLKEHFSNYKDAIEEYVEILFSTEALPDTLVGDIGNDIDEFKTAIISTLLRRWAVENNYLTEVLDIVTNNNKDVEMSILNEYKDYSNMVIKILLDFLKKNKKNKDRNQKIYDKINEEPIEEEEIPEEDGFTDESTDGGDDITDDVPEVGDNEPSETNNTDEPPVVDIPKE